VVLIRWCAESIRGLRAIRAWVAHATAAGLTLGDPAAYRVPAAVIAIDLIDGKDGAATGQIADDTGLVAAVAAVPCLTDGGSCDAENECCRGEGEDFFHDVERVVRQLSTRPLSAYSTTVKIF